MRSNGARASTSRHPQRRRVARMSDPQLIKEIQEAVTIPVMAKVRIGHIVKCQILEALSVDYIDESEVLMPADDKYHVDKNRFNSVPFVCGCRNLGEALRRIAEGAAMIRTKGEAGTGDVAEAVRHMRTVKEEIAKAKIALAEGDNSLRSMPGDGSNSWRLSGHLVEFVPAVAQRLDSRLARANNAIIISPNYRLLPEACGREILDDIHSFCYWLHSGKVDQILGNARYGERLKVDLDSILAVGESAGGYLATQLAISYPSQIKGLIAAYPMVDLRSPLFTEPYQKPIVGVPNIPDSLVDRHLLGMTSTRRSNTSPFSWITATDPPDRLELAFSIIQNGLFPERFGGWKDRELFPMERIEDLLATGRNLQLPPMFILHGENDSAVPVDGSKRFVQFLRRVMPRTPVMFHTQGGDHGFDAEETLATPWLRDGLEMISRAWLRPFSANL